MKVVLLCNRKVHDVYVAPNDLARLAAIAEVTHVECDHPSAFEALPDPTSDEVAWLAEKVAGADAVVVGPGAPRLSAAVFDACSFRFVGELEGDRFSPRVDLDAAAAHGCLAVDTTHGSSYAVAEWALALTLFSLRNASVNLREFFADDDVRLDATRRESSRGYLDGELRAKRVGLVGLGYIAQELIGLLAPFDVELVGYDPFVDQGRAVALDVDLAPIDVLLTSCDVVVLLAPETPVTRHLLDARTIGLLRPGAVLVNVSRGSLIDSDALLERLTQGDLWVGLDVWDPDPNPVGSALRDYPNVVYSPHIAGVTLAGRQRMFSLMVDELARFADGRAPRSQLDARARSNRGNV